ncbi:MAG: UDP-N-acetylmuramoyl-L-alanyl-D-glutamate--2,6-diaminopimelate ligase [Bacteroidales bacterium]|nr:UDP-N-acetylmuramoyl-L-alanyl-D-glutamate--2,6-diaminopimelate ligase [Bacteroidales bacterium]
MNLKNILEDITFKSIQGNLDRDVHAVVFDSRGVSENDLFVAVKGTITDGHQYIETAAEKGATTIVCEEIPKNISQDITVLQVTDSAKALSLLAANFYGNPSREMKVVGVTGTNGKTTIATLLYNLFEKAGYKSGLLSTVENYIHTTIIPSTHTTPDPIQIQNLMRQMVDTGCDYCFMEVSSHAIKQERIAGIEFNGGIFTNITHDHLDYHKTFKDYLYTKKRFFDDLPQTAFAIINNDDINSKVMVQNCQAKVHLYSLFSPVDFHAKILQTDFTATHILLNDREIWVKLIGKFNIANLLAIYGAATLLGLSEEEALLHISELNPVKGRMETILLKDNKTVVIDYAHTPDALKNILEVLNDIETKGENIITVFGAGGNRDKTKRPEMGEIAAKLSGKIIITSDNPRNENPEAIIEDIFAGIPIEKRKNTLTITDRKSAIKTAIMMANENDIILIAGKGHETYQEVNGVKSHFSDRETVEEIMNYES